MKWILVKIGRIVDRVNIIKDLKIVGINIGEDRSGNKANNRGLRGKDHIPNGRKSLEKLSGEKDRP